MTTNFITPPDFVEEPNHSILLVDVDPVDVETLAHLCAGHDESFNIYLYKADMEETAWLDKCISRVDAIIVNTVENEFSPIKDKMVDLTKTYHYGPKNFLSNNRQYVNFLEYFINRSNVRTNQITSSL